MALRAAKLPSVGSLAILVLLGSLVWLDARTQAVVTTASSNTETVEAGPSVHAALSGPSPMPPPDSVADRPSDASASSATRVEGLLLGVSPDAPDAVPSQGPSSRIVSRRPDLVVTDADGGVWLRAAPGNGSQIKLLENGTRLVDLGERQDAGGKRWRRVEDPLTGEGWIADAYVRDLATAPRSASAHRQPPPAATDRPIVPEVAGHLTTIQPRLQSVDEALQDLISATTRAVERPGLFTDIRWKAELMSRALVLQDRARELQLIGAPPELDRFSRTLADANRELTAASDELVQGIEALDPVRIGEADDRLDRVAERLDRASSDLVLALGRE